MKSPATNRYRCRVLSSVLTSKEETCIVYSRVKRAIITIFFCKTISILTDIVSGSTFEWRLSRRAGIPSLLQIFQEKWSFFRCCFYSLSAHSGGGICERLELNVRKLCFGIVEAEEDIGLYSLSIASDKVKKYTFPYVLLILFLGC